MKRKPVESSALRSAGYDPRTHILELEFTSGAVYRYKWIPGRVYRGLIHSPSQGRYFSRHIRNMYPHERVDAVTRRRPARIRLGKQAGPQVLSIVGRSGSGKTTLLEKLIPELKQRGYRVGTVKHHAHPGFEIDQPGKDTWRHAQAGSDHVVIAAPDRMASIRRTEHPLTLDEILSTMTDVDIVITEGFKRARKPALEIMRQENGTDLVSDPDQRLAIASDTSIDVGVPHFNLNDVTAIADWIEETFLK